MSIIFLRRMQSLVDGMDNVVVLMCGQLISLNQEKRDWDGIIHPFSFFNWHVFSQCLQDGEVVVD